MLKVRRFQLSTETSRLNDQLETGSGTKITRRNVHQGVLRSFPTSYVVVGLSLIACRLLLVMIVAYNVICANQTTDASPSLPTKPSQGDRTLMLAFDALEARSFPHAFSLFNEAIDQRLSSSYLESEALNMRATFRFIMGEAQLALEDLDRATEIWPGGVQSYVKKASVHMELGMPTEAFEDFEEALRIEPNNPDVYVVLFRPCCCFIPLKDLDSSRNADFIIEDKSTSSLEIIP